MSFRADLEPDQPLVIDFDTTQPPRTLEVADLFGCLDVDPDDPEQRPLGETAVWGSIQRVTALRSDGDLSGGVVVVGNSGLVAACVGRMTSPRELLVASASGAGTWSVCLAAITACIAFQNPFADQLDDQGRRAQQRVDSNLRELLAWVADGEWPSMGAVAAINTDLRNYLAKDRQLRHIINHHHGLRQALRVKVEREQLTCLGDVTALGQVALDRRPVLVDLDQIAAAAAQHGQSSAGLLLDDE